MIYGVKDIAKPCTSRDPVTSPPSYVGNDLSWGMCRHWNQHGVLKNDSCWIFSCRVIRTIELLVIRVVKQVGNCRFNLGGYRSFIWHFFTASLSSQSVVAIATAFPKPCDLLGERQSIGGICDPENGNGDCSDPNFPSLSIRLYRAWVGSWARSDFRLRLYSHGPGWALRSHFPQKTEGWKRSP